MFNLAILSFLLTFGVAVVFVQQTRYESAILCANQTNMSVRELSHHKPGLSGSLLLPTKLVVTDNVTALQSGDIVAGTGVTVTIVGYDRLVGIGQSVATGATPSFLGATFSGLTASKFVKTDGSKALISADVTAGTGVTITPVGNNARVDIGQDVSTTAIPQFTGVKSVGGGSILWRINSGLNGGGNLYPCTVNTAVADAATVNMAASAFGPAVNSVTLVELRSILIPTISGAAYGTYITRYSIKATAGAVTATLIDQVKSESAVNIMTVSIQTTATTWMPRVQNNLGGGATATISGFFIFSNVA